jgi:hypothetical protein
LPRAAASELGDAKSPLDNRGGAVHDSQSSMLEISRLLRHSFAAAGVVGLCSTAIHARPNGFAVECGGCHYGQLEGGGMAPAPAVIAVATKTRVEPGEQVEITVSVESNWPDALVSGFLVMTAEGGGVFTPSDEETGNVGVTDGQPFEYAIGHTAARTLVGGKATFQTTWTAPAIIGAYEFAVFGVTSDDGDGMDDPEIAEESNEPVGKFELAIGVGCDLVTYYSDGDGDGYGTNETLSCDKPAGYAAEGGDCDDDNPAVNPGATELCSFADENCDGERMAPPTFYRDDDGDGYGAPAELLVEGCTAPAGYAAESGDCAPNDAMIHPAASELPGTGVDENCNGMTDEAGGEPAPTANPVPTDAPSSEPGPTAPAGTSPAGTSPAGTSPLPAADPTMTSPAAPMGSGASGGCRLSTGRSGYTHTAILVLLCATLIRRRLKVTLSV